MARPPSSGSDILLYFIAIFLPPVSVFIKRGCGADFWINIGLSIRPSPPLPYCPHISLTDSAWQWLGCRASFTHGGSSPASRLRPTPAPPLLPPNNSPNTVPPTSHRLPSSRSVGTSIEQAWKRGRGGWSGGGRYTPPVMILAVTRNQ